MAFTQTQLDAIENAITMGELTITFDGKTVTYRSTDELLRIRNIIRADLAGQGVVDAGSRDVIVEFIRD